MPCVAAIAETDRLGLSWSVELPEAVVAACWIGDSLLVGSADGHVRKYAPVGEPTFEVAQHAGGITRIELRPDGARVASAGEDGRVILWDPATGELEQEISRQPSWVEHLAWSSDGRTLAAAAEKTVYLWRDGESLGAWYDPRRRVLDMAWAPDGKRLATAANKGLFLWYIGGHEAVRLMEFPGAPVAAAWDRTGGSLAVGTQDGFLQIWQQGKNAPARQLTMRGYPSKVGCLDWHPSQPVIASAGGPDVVLWETQGAGAGRKAHPLRYHRHTVTSLRYAPDASLLASGDRGGRLCLWDAKGSLAHTLELDNEITALSWSPDGGRLICGTTGGLLRSYKVLAGSADDPMFHLSVQP